MDSFFFVYVLLQLVSSWIAFNGVGTLIRSYRRKKSGDVKVSNFRVVIGIASVLGGLSYFVMHAVDFHGS